MKLEDTFEPMFIDGSPFTPENRLWIFNNFAVNWNHDVLVLRSASTAYQYGIDVTTQETVKLCKRSDVRIDDDGINKCSQWKKWEVAHRITPETSKRITKLLSDMYEYEKKIKPYSDILHEDAYMFDSRNDNLFFEQNKMIAESNPILAERFPKNVTKPWEIWDKAVIVRDSNAVELSTLIEIGKYPALPKTEGLTLCNANDLASKHNGDWPSKRKTDCDEFTVWSNDATITPSVANLLTKLSKHVRDPIDAPLPKLT